MNIGLYVHIPFCRQKCLYCDFPSYCSLEALYEPYTNALCREISGQGALFPQAMVDTIYIGGGTPTLLSPISLGKIITEIRKAFQVSPEAEISIEANPGTVSPAALRTMREIGISRISFGVQTFSDSLLPLLGRIHTKADALSAILWAKEAGFTNINVDLMYGLPEQTIANFKHSLETAVSLAIPHVSVYGLKVEEGTPFAALSVADQLALPSEEVEESMYDMVTDYLPACGYERYEISNYAVSGYVCRHNLKYWNFEPYIGVGAAAASFINGIRTTNVVDVSRYIAMVASATRPIGFIDDAGRDAAMGEYIFLALRLTVGLDANDFARRFGVGFFDKYRPVVESLLSQQLLHRTTNGVALTVKGMKYGNQVFAAFLPD